jgi:very-short-patch-repair endonuclease
VFADVHPALQARQLALALEGDHLRVVVALQPASLDALGLDAVGRALEWFAAHTRARLIGVLPAELAAHEGLDRVGYGARTIRFSAADVGGAPPEEPIAVVHPVIGRPHPLSRVEQHLAQVLGRVEDLRTLFEFNQRIETARGSHAIVDLLWREGRVIVEIDGWDTHGNRGAFASDRQRDYELVLSGYLILRLTNEEVLSDAALSVDKIRDVVRFRRIEKGAQ